MQSFYITYQEVFNASMKRTHPDTEKYEKKFSEHEILYNLIIIFTNAPVFSITVCFDFDLSNGLGTA